VAARPGVGEDEAMYRASWNGTVIAQSDDTVEVEGNQYFPMESVQRDLLTETDTHTHCPWKGEASYFDITVEGQTNGDAAWYYPQPLPAADTIAGRVAFWKGVTVEQA
jgi:uncharacterized protein (DUF427 family)